MKALPRKVIKNRFFILEDLGQGGYGSVHKAIDKVTNEMVAIKYLIDRRPGNETKNLSKFQTTHIQVLQGQQQIFFCEDNGADQHSNRKTKQNSILQIQSASQKQPRNQGLASGSNFEGIQLQRNNIRWSSLPTIMKNKTDLILNIKKAIDEVSIKETTFFTLVQKCRDTTDRVIDVSMPLTQEELQNSQVKCLNAYQSHLNLLFVMILEIQIYNQTQGKEHIQDIDIATKNKNFEYHFREERFQALIQSLVFTFKYTQVQQESTFKVTNLAIKTLENLANQGGLKQKARQPEHPKILQQNPIKPVQEDVEMEDEESAFIDAPAKPKDRLKPKPIFINDVLHQKSLTSI